MSPADGWKRAADGTYVDGHRMIVKEGSRWTAEVNGRTASAATLKLAKAAADTLSVEGAVVERWLPPRTRTPERPIPPGWPLKSGHLSASSVACLMRCPEMFRREYVLGQKRPWTQRAVTGSAVHSTLESVWNHVRVHGELPPVTSALDLLRDVYDELDGKVGEHLPIAESKDGRLHAETCLGAYLRHPAAATVKPVAIEEWWQVSVEGIPVPIVGKIDLRCENMILDVKTGKKVHNAIDPEWRVASLAYLLPHDLPVQYHSIGYTGAVAAGPELAVPRSPLNLARAYGTFRHAVRTIDALLAQFGRDEPWPAALVHGWACGSCSFRVDGSCQHWHPRVATPELDAFPF